MSLEKFSALFLPKIEKSLQKTIEEGLHPGYEELSGMLKYHMGWEGDGAGVKAQGKRIRPILVLLSAIASNEEWENFMPLAVSVELIHNFSLIHDDIEDDSFYRRGRKTIWAIWGIPQAINVGDLLYTIAHQSLLENKNFTIQQTAEASYLIHQTCVRLTQGQYLDMKFEQHLVTVDEYWKMIEGKTAALIGCCTELGALKLDSSIRSKFKNFGTQLGLAFQVQDDLLGLWGEFEETGKSAESDLISRKKTLPILYGIEHNLSFKKRWLQQKQITIQEASEIAATLKNDGTYTYTSELVDTLTSKAVNNLLETGIQNDGIDALIEFARKLTRRNH